MKTQEGLGTGRLAVEQLPRGGYIRQAQLIPGLLPFSPATLWRKVKNGSFPQPVKLSDRITAWRRDEISDWLDARHAK